MKKEDRGTKEYVVQYYDGDEWNRLCARPTIRSAVIARNRYFGRDSGIRPDVKITEETIN